MALFYAQTKLVSPSGRDVAQRQRGLAPSYAQFKLVSPSERDVAQRQRGLIPASMFLKVYPDTNLSASCPLSHLLRKCQLSRRESQEAGADWESDESGELDANLLACCSFRHGLRRATFLREKGFYLARNPTCLSLWERCRAATERARLPP